MIDCCVSAGGGSLVDIVLGTVVDILMVLAVLLGRFVTGVPLDGRQRTDCGFLHRGTHPVPGGPKIVRWYAPAQVATWWAFASHAERAVIRVGVTAVTAVVTYGVLVVPEVTAPVAAIALVVICGRLASQRPAQRVSAVSTDQGEVQLMLLAVRRVPQQLAGHVTATVIEEQAAITASNGDPYGITAAFTQALEEGRWRA